MIKNILLFPCFLVAGCNGFSGIPAGSSTPPVGDHVPNVLSKSDTAWGDFSISSESRQALAAAAAGDRTFKLRIGADLRPAADFLVGDRSDSNSVTIPIQVSRLRGQGPLDVSITYAVIEGVPGNWTIVPPQSIVTLGLPSSYSYADHDNDGDVDLVDWSKFVVCYSGPLNLYPLNQGMNCATFDVDYDLDVDLTDMLGFVTAYTGVLSPSWREDLTMVVSAGAGVSEESYVLLRVSGTDNQTGETHDVLAKVTMRSYRLEITLLSRQDLTTERTSKLTAGRDVFFDFRVAVTGANPDIVRLTPIGVDDPPGITLRTYDSSMQPLTQFLLAPLEFDRSIFYPPGSEPDPSWPPWKRTVRLGITLPENFPIHFPQSFALQTTGLGGNMSQIEVEVTRIPALWTPSDLLSSTGRRHLVRPGLPTTFLLLVTNTFDQTKTFSLTSAPVGPVSEWSFGLSTDSLLLDPGQQAEVVATLTALPAATLGAVADWDVTLTDTQGFSTVCRLGAEATDMRKTIFVDINGLQPEYMYLNADGTGSGGSGDWLMPNVQEFMTLSANYVNATCSLPAATDINVVNALSGTRTGTAGIPSVIFYYQGRDPHGCAVTVTTDATLLRFGPDGAPVLTAFDVAKQSHPRAFTAIVAGKNWIPNLFTKTPGGVDLVFRGQSWPHYVSPPSAYVLGDPSTDLDADQDPPSRTEFSQWGWQPGRFPEDRWLMTGSMRIIANEDPDVFYILLTNLDEVQHAGGSAWNLDEWDDQGTSSTWDDISRVNPLATREETLDVVREADHLFGELIEFLRDRGTLDDTILVLLSDHGMQTETPTTIDPRIVLERAGYMYKDDFDMYGGSGVTLVYDVASENQAAVETLLETSPSIVPSLNQNPWIVINRAEMRTGLDTFTNLRVADPGELYSEFYVEHEIPEPIQQRWPSFFIFLLGPWQFEPTLIHRGEAAVQEQLFVGGHAGPDTQRIPIVLFGPGVVRGEVFAEPVTIADIAPTLYDLQGWVAPPSVEGIRLPGLLSGP